MNLLLEIGPGPELYVVPIFLLLLLFGSLYFIRSFMVLRQKAKEADRNGESKDAKQGLGKGKSKE